MGTLHYTVLGTTGIQVSNLCLGTMTFGREASVPDAERIYRMCRERGVNFIDTSNNYARGESERLVGTLIAAERSEVIVATKVSSPTGSDLNARGYSRRHIMAAVEDSLQRLQSDYSVDIDMTDDLYGKIASLSPTPPLATDRAEETHTDAHERASSKPNKADWAKRQA